MKRMVLICSMLALTNIVLAQAAAMGSNAWDGGTTKKYNHTIFAPANELDGITMVFKEGNAIFADIPETRRPIWAVVTNSTGDFIKQMRLTTEQNIMELHRLRNGLYFVTIVYKGKSKKAFTINL